MCGRYTNLTPLKAWADLFGAPAPGGELPPRYNVAPSERVLACRLAESGARELVWLRWGLVPRWSRDPASGPHPINARAESAAEKPMFREAFRRRRCLVAADGFYEWKPVGRGKAPYYLRLRGHTPFAFAGLWERWGAPGGEAIETCAVLVTGANTLIAPLHDRMPVILDPSGFGSWLDPATPRTELDDLLRPLASERMEAYRVSPAVNRAGVEGPELIRPLEETPEPAAASKGSGDRAGREPPLRRQDH